MKKNVIAATCSFLLAVAIVVPASLQFSPKPEAAIVGDVVTAMNDQGGSGAAAEPDVIAYDEPQASVEEESYEQPEYDQGVMLVGLADGVSVEQFNERLASLDYIATQSITEDDVMFGYVLLDLAEGVEVEDAIARVEAEDVVSGAEPDYVLYAQEVSPADKAYAASSLQAGDIAKDDLSAQTVSINDPYRDDQWALDAVNAYEAWESSKGEDASPKVTVAILDSGMNVNHPDFAGTTIVDPYSFLSNSGDVTDTFGHGTHVAGIVAATAHNGEGVAGVSYNAQIMPVQVIDSVGGTTQSRIIQGLDYVVKRIDEGHVNVKVINISIGSKSAWSSSSTTQAYKAALKSVHDHDILVVYAAGNYASKLNGAYSSFPCDEDTYEGAIGVISVAQSNGSYTRSDFSNYNQGNVRTKELSAPGTSILSTAIEGASDQVTYKDKDGVTQAQYAYKSGTSMAAPCVAGIAALLYAEYPELTAANVRKRLVDTANDFDGGGWTAETGYGLVDAQAALLPQTEANSDIAIAPIADQSYTGTAIEPSVVVTYNGTTLTKGADYTVTYSHNLNAGTAAVKVICVGAYAHAGFQTATFKIKPVSLNNAAVSVSDQTYTGAALKPQPTVVVNDRTLTPSQDFTVSYDNNTNAGTATVTVSGKNNYTGTASGSFTIKPAKLASIALSQSNVTYNGYQQTPYVYVYGPKNGKANQVLLEGIDYTLTTPSGRTSAGKYTYEAVGISPNYSSNKVSATLTIKALNVQNATIRLSQSSYTYDGTAKAPAVTVKSGTTTLKAGTDYRATFSNNINAGTGVVTITGLTSDCTGTTTKTFAINKAAISSVTLSPATDAYDGSQKNPAITVKGSNGLTLSSSEYTVSAPSGRTMPGSYEYVVTAVANGNYEGTGKATLTITGQGGSGYSPSTPSSSQASTPSSSSSSSTPSSQEVTSKSMYRLYNPNSGEHFYTASSYERDSLVSAGWKHEGTGWIAPSSSSTPVFRLYNPNAGDHHYTTSSNERDQLKNAGWTYEGIGWYSDDAQGTELFRLYNPNATTGSHHYTPSASERDALSSNGWKYEGIAWYGIRS